MKEAAGNTFVFNWVIFFLWLILFLFIGSLIYSRTFKIRNEVVSIIELNQGWSSDTQKKVNEFLDNINYRRTTDFQGRPLRGRAAAFAKVGTACRVPDGGGTWNTVYNESDGFMACVYHETNLNYYRVEVFLSLSLPVVGEFMTFPVSGETRRMIDFNN